VKKNEIVNTCYKLPRVRSSFAAVSIQNLVYVCGGTDGKVLNSLEILDLTTNKWSKLASMSNKREEFGFVIGADNKLYAIGGFDGHKCLTECERFDLISGSWENIAPLNIPRRALCTVSMPDGIYAIGGYDGEKYINSVER